MKKHHVLKERQGHIKDSKVFELIQALNYISLLRFNKRSAACVNCINRRESDDAKLLHGVQFIPEQSDDHISVFRKLDKFYVIITLVEIMELFSEEAIDSEMRKVMLRAKNRIIFDIIPQASEVTLSGQNGGGIAAIHTYDMVLFHGMDGETGKMKKPIAIDIFEPYTHHKYREFILRFLPLEYKDYRVLFSNYEFIKSAKFFDKDFKRFDFQDKRVKKIKIEEDLEIS